MEKKRERDSNGWNEKGKEKEMDENKEGKGQSWRVVVLEGI